MMKIKTKLLSIAGFSALAIVVLGIFLYFSLHSYYLAIEKNNIANQIANNIFENNLLLSEYLLYYEDRPRDLWVSKNDDIVALVKSQSVKFSKDSEKEIIKNLLEVIGKNQKAFLELITSREGGSKNGVEQQARLSAQLLINNQEAVSFANQLAVASAQDSTIIQKMIVYFLVGFVILIFTVVAVILFSIWLSIVGPLLKLKEAAERIASLDFTTTTTTTTTAPNDEVGQLARALYIMASKIRETYEKLRERTSDLENSNIATQNILEDLEFEKESLANTKAKDEALLQSIGDGIIATDPERRIIIMNKKAEDLLGWKIDEAIGKYYDDVVLLEDEKGTFVPPNEKPLHKAFDKRVTTSATTTDTATATTTTGLYLISKNKIKFPVAIIVSPVILNNKIIGAVEVFRDITEEKKIDKAKTEFVSLASHQLRTPLTAISWYTEMILNGDVGKVVPSQKKYLEEIYQGNQRMVELVNTLLDVSRFELGTLEIAPKPTDMIALAESVLAEQKLEIAKKQLVITKEFGKSVPVFLIDPKLLRMVFQNLLANAVEYTPLSGRIEFAISLDNKNILIKVSDTGYGIPKNQQDKIFTKFFRADNVRGKDTDGTGLGLYIVKSIVENFGGKIWFSSPGELASGGESPENPGTTFFVAFPLNGVKKENDLK